MAEPYTTLPPPTGHRYGYPHLVIRYASAVFGVVPLADDLSIAVLLAFAWAAMDACHREYRMCLTLGPEHAVYLECDGTYRTARHVPLGGAAILCVPDQLGFLPVRSLPWNGVSGPFEGTIGWMRYLRHPSLIRNAARGWRGWRKLRPIVARALAPFEDWFRDVGPIVCVGWLFIHGCLAMAGLKP
jgi:hypothetical protein